MLNGLKLLLADDSVAIQKVIDLTFTDEGMEVTTFGDGDQARDRLEEIGPDIVLADAFMPGIDGYELCRVIRQTERFKEIPVILLVGSFEPFNEADARQAGASDVVTKPFQSIRDLVSRVGSLLGNKSENAEAAHQYSTLGLGQIDERVPGAAADHQTTEPDLKVFVEAPSPDDDSMKDANVNVLVEAASMPEHESAGSAGTSCATDIELQTADTRQLERIDDQDIKASSEPLYAQDDTIEIEPVIETDASMGVARVTEEPSFDNRAPVKQTAMPPESADLFSDTLLDLGEVDKAAVGTGREDVILDLDFAEVVTQSPSEVPPAEIGVVEAADAAAPINVIEAEQATPTAQTANVGDLSPETIDAIARRVVEQMSEKVVREIAWEVVPELAELLIKQKLDEKK